MKVTEHIEAVLGFIQFYILDVIFLNIEVAMLETLKKRALFFCFFNNFFFFFFFFFKQFKNAVTVIDLVTSRLTLFFLQIGYH